MDIMPCLGENAAKHEALEESMSLYLKDPSFETLSGLMDAVIKATDGFDIQDVKGFKLEFSVSKGKKYIFSFSKKDKSFSVEIKKQKSLKE